MSEQLTPRQELFCREYIIDYNGKQAAARAGYSEKSSETQAARLLRNDKVLSRVRELQAEQVKRLSISADWVIIKLKETLDQCMAAVPVMVWDPELKCKVESGDYVFDSKGAERALELIGKHIGMFTDKVEVKGQLDTGQKKLDDILHQLRGNDSG